MMLRLSIFFAGLIQFSLAAAQQTFISDKATGRPYMVQQYNDVQGSPFLSEDWKKASVTDASGTTFIGVLIKFDAYSNKFLFNHNGNAYEFVTDISEVEITPELSDSPDSIIFKKGFAINGKISPDKYVQVLAAGKVNFVKHIYKVIEERSEYNVPGKIRSFVLRTAYYFSLNGIWQNEKPGNKFFESLLKDKWKTVETYIKEYSLNVKKEEDAVRIISYYNSL